ncbi:MAG: hypothetical protein JW917_03705 [Ignavibacteria bacterium]|nr:hypothetical protein [Ignavibacteria bacterium]
MKVTSDNTKRDFTQRPQRSKVRKEIFLAETQRRRDTEKKLEFKKNSRKEIFLVHCGGTQSSYK